jgi:hypothetical protein
MHLLLMLVPLVIRRRIKILLTMTLPVFLTMRILVGNLVISILTIIHIAILHGFCISVVRNIGACGIMVTLLIIMVGYI